MTPTIVSVWAVELDGPPDHLRVGVERALPEPLADDRHRVRTGRQIVIRRQHTAERGSDPEHLEVAAADKLGPDAFVPALECQAHRHEVGRRQGRKGLAVIAEIFEVGVRERHGSATRGASDHDAQTVRFMNPGQGAKRDSFEQAEDRRVGPDAESEHGDHHQREARCSAKSTQRIAHVVPEVAYHLE